MRDENFEVLMEIGKWRLINDPSYPVALSILHQCPTLGKFALKKTRVTCLGNWVSFRQGVCCGCELTIPTDMLALGRFAHWEQLYGYKR
jgi:hypothetical protein